MPGRLTFGRESAVMERNLQSRQDSYRRMILQAMVISIQQWVRDSSGARMRAESRVPRESTRP